MTTERIYRYPDGTRQRLGASLDDDVPVANATERTAPKVGDVIRSRDVLRPGQQLVDRTLLVALLDAWQAHCDAEQPSLTEPAAFVEVERARAWEALLEALAAFAEEVDL